MEKNRVKSRTDVLIASIRSAHSVTRYSDGGGLKIHLDEKAIRQAVEQYITTRPSVPQQGQARLSYRKWLLEQQANNFAGILNSSLEDAYGDYCSALAASRLEVATGQQCPKCRQRNLDQHCTACGFGLQGYDELKAHWEAESGAPAAGLMPSCTVCGEIMQGVCKCGSKTGAAGSTERAYHLERCDNFNHLEARLEWCERQGWQVVTVMQIKSSDFVIVCALAQTDTDVTTSCPQVGVGGSHSESFSEGNPCIWCGAKPFGSVVDTDVPKGE